MQRPKGNRCEVTKFEQIEPIVEPAFTVRAWEIEIPVRLPAQSPTQPGIVENFNFPNFTAQFPDWIPSTSLCTVELQLPCNQFFGTVENFNFPLQFLSREFQLPGTISGTVENFNFSVQFLNSNFPRYIFWYSKEFQLPGTISGTVT